MRDSGQRKLTYSSQNHCTSTLRSGRRKTIVSQTMCAPAERLSQSEIVLPLRKTCYYSPLAEVGVFSTCLLYTSDAADEEDSVDLGGRRIIKKKKKRDCEVEWQQ